ncbi:PAS domain-containing sensor histidine kinase [Insulibacter thermoxylanivorax]|uniref:histidine kinase n=2 Tax=Insulibacter thermoxylanivorax TaxID=2749268 RepID=A0A916VG72_9BACL|nr:PAS domain-containing sensor histidine kinase [Insulibacter thermoxylanivorax]
MMRRTSFFHTIQFKVIIIFVLLILFAMQLIGVYFLRTLENSFINNFSESLRNQAAILANYVQPYLAPGNEGQNEQQIYQELDAIINNLNTISGAEIQVIDSTGVVVSASSQLPRSIIGQRNSQTEVTRALQGIRMNEKEIIDSNGIRKKTIAIRVGEGGQVYGAVYMVASMEEQFETINNIIGFFMYGTFFALGMTVLLSIILSNTITKPIKEITKQATEMAEGNFSRSVAVKSSDEIGQLGEAFNYMSKRLREALASNEEEKKRLASILSNMSDGVIATDDAGRVIVMNRRAEQILDLTADEAMGKPISEVLGVTLEETLEYTLGQDVSVLLHREKRDEEIVNVRVNFTAIRRDEEVTGIIAVLHDVTEEEKMENSRREFVANVSHELRTPLTTIKSYLEALEDGALEDPELARRFIGVTRTESERMIRLVNDLLHLSRFDSHQATMFKEPVEIQEMLEEVIDRFSFQLQQRDIRINLNIEPGMPLVSCDPDQIDQVLDNLISNAIKFSYEGGLIEVTARQLDQEFVQISVKDSGIGIPQRHLERIFERFYRVDKARSRNMGGTGLGLSIAREIVKAHGGTIHLDSEMNKGTTVVFTLPLHREEGAAV